MIGDTPDSTSRQSDRFGQWTKPRPSLQMRRLKMAPASHPHEGKEIEAAILLGLELLPPTLEYIIGEVLADLA